MKLADYVIHNTERGECKCGQCIDRGDRTDTEGHTVDMVFFKVSKKNGATAEEFRRLTVEHKGEFTAVDPFDGKEHGYIELGAWIGDQGLAMQYMALGVALGEFDLLSPKTVLGLEGEEAFKFASIGYLTIKRAQPRAAVPHKPRANG